MTSDGKDGVEEAATMIATGVSGTSAEGQDSTAHATSLERAPSLRSLRTHPRYEAARTRVAAAAKEIRDALPRTTD